ncbi:winged helix DNA-binding domain-containing protein [Nocardioides koreensis]|uniref:Winged helix DNA-binding domain-containing protein n=1 Tax=Nocardioides koreensis TaxID=433651 RepID=A0ABN3A704_9ACTN
MSSRLTARRLNRTLLQRQHLLARTDLPVDTMVRHLVGLQAQDNLPPYLSLHARLTSFDPYDVSRGLEDRTLVRLLTMRGTIHLLTAQDALTLRPWVQARLEQQMRGSATYRPACDLDPDAFAAALAAALAAGPVNVRTLGESLADAFPEVPVAALSGLARVAAPLVQLPPRGRWKQTGGVVYDRLDRWVDTPLGEPDPAAVVRRYLGAFGPATAADVTAWSGVTGLAKLVAGMDDLVRYEDERARTLYDVPDGRLADEDAPAPVRLLGTYDNLWLAHAGRDRVTTPENRRRWMGANGGTAQTVFVDGMLEGLWRLVDGRVEVDPFRRLARAERADLDAEVARVDALLAL